MFSSFEVAMKVARAEIAGWNFFTSLSFLPQKINVGISTRAAGILGGLEKNKEQRHATHETTTRFAYRLLIS